MKKRRGLFWGITAVFVLCTCVYAGTKITQLNELAETPADSDIVLIVDVSDTTMGASGTNKKITVSNLVAAAGGGSANIEDDVYSSGWNADTTNGASQNAIYDYLHQLDTDDDGDIDTIDATVSATFESSTSDNFDVDRLAGDSVNDDMIDSSLISLDNIEGETHASEHLVGSVDTIFPADPGADKYLKWDDDPGELVWDDAAGGGGSVEDDVYGSGWNGDTANAPSQNAVYDYLHQLDTDDDGDIDTLDATLEATFESATSDDFDPDRLAGDSDDDDKIEQTLIDGVGSSTTPSLVLNDSDCPGTDKESGQVGASYTDGADGSENCDLTLDAMVAGTMTTFVTLDGSADQIVFAKGFAIVETEYLPIAYGIDGGTAPAELETITSTNKVNVRKFDGAAQDEDVYVTWQAPSDLDAVSGVKFRVLCLITEATTPSAETWQFEMQGLSSATGDALGGGLGTAQTSNSGSRTDAQYDFVYTAWSSAMTTTHISGLTAGEAITLKLYRDIDDTDTYAQDVGVVGIEFKYKREHDTTW